MKIGFLLRDSHFAFNLSNIHSFKEVKAEAKIHKLNQTSMNVLLSYFESSDILQIGRLSKKIREGVQGCWPEKAKDI